MHIEFPRCLHGAGGKTLIVHTEADRDRELASGSWFLRPVTEAPEAPAPIAESAPDFSESIGPPVHVIHVTEDAPKKRGRKKAETVN